MSAQHTNLLLALLIGLGWDHLNLWVACIALAVLAFISVLDSM